MSEREKLRDSFEDFTARLLAVDPTDVGRISSLKDGLEVMLKSVETRSGSADLLKLGLTALGAIEHGNHANTSGILDAIAAATAAVVNDISAPDDGAGIAEAAASLKALLAQDAGAAPAAAAPACERQPPAKPSPAPTASSSLDDDPELVRDFIAESCDRIAAAEAALLALEANPDDKEQINTILRAFHTVKGASGFLGLDRIQNLAHLAENLLIKARDGHIRMADEHADAALQSCDVLRIMVKSLAPASGATESQDAARIAALVERLSNIDAPKASPAAVAATEAPAEAPQVEAVSTEHSEAAPKSGNDNSSRLAEGIRVNAERLDDLVNMVGELVIAHSLIAQSPVVTARADHQLSGRVSHAGKILRSLQDMALGLRMVPLRPTFGKMARLVRDLSRKSGKSIRLVTSGEDTEIDRNMVEVLSDPLIHMIRNAVDHGIEPQQDRLGSGKESAGTIRLSAFHSAGNVVIELQDDGQGLCRERILASAIERGLVEAGRELSDADVYQMIFLPGLSTAQQVTDVSGRGVGMDVVKRNVESLRGKIEVKSTPGAGSTFTLRLPLTLAIADAMLLSVGKERFLLPTIAIEHSFRPLAGMIHTVTGRGEMVTFRGQVLPVFRLDRLFGIAGASADPCAALLIVIESGPKRCAIMVDDLLGQQQVVIKSLGKMFAHIPGVSGGAIIGDGRVGLILDAAGLVQLAHGQAKAA